MRIFSVYCRCAFWSITWNSKKIVGVNRLEMSLFTRFFCFSKTQNANRKKNTQIAKKNCIPHRISPSTQFSYEMSSESYWLPWLYTTPLETIKTHQYKQTNRHLIFSNTHTCGVTDSKWRFYFFNHCQAHSSNVYFRLVLNKTEYFADISVF